MHPLSRFRCVELGNQTRLRSWNNDATYAAVTHTRSKVGRRGGGAGWVPGVERPRGLFITDSATGSATRRAAARLSSLSVYERPAAAALCHARSKLIKSVRPPVHDVYRSEAVCASHGLHIVQRDTGRKEGEGGRRVRGCVERNIAGPGS